MVVATKEQVDAAFRVGVGGARLKPNQYILDVEKALARNVQEAMLKLGANVVLNLEDFAPNSSNRLNSSFDVIGVKETKTGYRLEISVGVDYSDYVDKGVKPVKGNPKGRKFYKNADGIFYKFKNYGMPIEALRSLAGWVKRKNIELEATALINNQKVPDEIDATTRTLAYFIKKNGIEGRQFIKRSIDKATPDFNFDLQSIGTNTLILRIAK
jgi:hypothetical protein